MSTSLVHKSLELLGFEKESRKAQKRKKKRKNIKYEGVWDLIPPKHRITSKDDQTDLDARLGRSSKISVYETQKRLAAQEDPTEKNVQRLLSLCSNRLNSKTTSTLLHRAVGKRYPQQQEKSEESEATAFTEEDFRKFEQEYTDDRQKGKAILIVTLISFLYYTIWVIGVPLIDDIRFRSLFFSHYLALVIPACFGLIFIGGLILFTVCHIRYAVFASTQSQRNRNNV